MAALSEETVDYILTLIRDKGADPNIPDAKGNTPLMYLVEKILAQSAEQQRSSELKLERKILKELIDSGADPSARNKAGDTAVQKCFSSGREDLVELLASNVSLNRDPSLFFAFGVRIFDVAVQEMLVRFMEKEPLEYEAVNVVDDFGYTPFLHYVLYYFRCCGKYKANLQRFLQRNGGQPQEQRITSAQLFDDSFWNEFDGQPNAPGLFQ